MKTIEVPIGNYALQSSDRNEIRTMFSLSCQIPASSTPGKSDERKPGYEVRDSSGYLHLNLSPEAESSLGLEGQKELTYRLYLYFEVAGLRR